MEWQKAEQVARLLNISKQTVWRYGREGKLETIRVGRTVRFRLKEEDK